MSSHRRLTHSALRCRMLEARDKDGEEGLLEDQLAWLQGISSFAARRAKGKHPQPQHEDPRLEKLQRDLLLVEKALPREALPGGAPPPPPQLAGWTTNYLHSAVEDSLLS